MSVVVASILFATLQMFLPPSSSERFVSSHMCLQYRIFDIDTVLGENQPL